MMHFIIGADVGGIGAVIIVAIFLFLKFSGKKIGGGIEKKLDNISPKPCRSCGELVEVKSENCLNCNIKKPAPFIYRELKTIFTYGLAIVVLGPPLFISLKALFSM